MKTINKSRAYAYLNRIKNECKVNVSPYIHKVAMSETVPYDVLIFINKHIGLPQLYTYNEIYKRMNKNPLYKNLVNENLDDENQAIALSSLLTQTLIHTKQMVKENEQEDVQEYAELMNVRAITEALNDYVNGDSTKLNETFLEVRNVVKTLYGGRKKI